MQTVGITQFVHRQLENTFAGTRLTQRQLSMCRSFSELALNRGEFSVGYAQFVRIVKIHNETLGGIHAPIVEITSDNKQFLRSKYRARSEGELAVLVRYFTNVPRQIANHTNVILYSHEQLQAEAQASAKILYDVPSEDWSIVSVNAEPDEKDSPMTPMTLLRNALGKEFGGSGHPLDVAKYAESVTYWSRYAETE